MTQDQKPYYHVAPATCPVCKAQHNAATEIDQQKKHAPQLGDWTVCIECAAILRFTADQRLRQPGVHELVTFRGSQPEEFARMMIAIKLIQQVKKDAEWIKKFGAN